MHVYVIDMNEFPMYLIRFYYIQDLGIAVAFNCPELDSILSAVDRVQKWKQQCMDIFTIGDENSLLGALEKVSN